MRISSTSPTKPGSRTRSPKNPAPTENTLSLVIPDATNKLTDIPATQAVGSYTLILDTNMGRTPLDLERYYSTQAHSDPIDILKLPLLLPTESNIEALAKHASSKLKALLGEYNIPLAPQKITYNNEGNMTLPNDYANKEEFTQALQKTPGLDRALHTVNALTNHYLELLERSPFTAEVANAQSLAEVDRIISKYSHLLNDNHACKNISLNFSANSELNITVDGHSYNRL